MIAHNRAFNRLSSPSSPKFHKWISRIQNTKVKGWFLCAQRIGEKGSPCILDSRARKVLTKAKGLQCEVSSHLVLPRAPRVRATCTPTCSMLINSDVRWYGVWRRSGRRAAGGEKGGTIIPLRKKKRKERKRREEKRRKERGINTKNEGDILIIGDQSVNCW